MEGTRETWTDARLDDLSRRVDGGFARLDADLRTLRSDMNSRFDALQRTIIQVGGGMVATMLVGVLTILLATI